MVYVCYDNEAYMNTGIQRSSATPRFADSTTTPVGSVQQGKGQNKKDLTEIMVAHGIPYVAQTTFIGNLRDLHEKSRKAIYTPGAAFLNVLSPCPRGWRYPAETIAAVVKAAVDSCVWPMFEVDQKRQRMDAGGRSAVGGSEMGSAAGKVQQYLNRKRGFETANTVSKPRLFFSARSPILSRKNGRAKTALRAAPARCPTLCPWPDRGALAR